MGIKTYTEPLSGDLIAQISLDSALVLHGRLVLADGTSSTVDRLLNDLEAFLAGRDVEPLIERTTGPYVVKPSNTTEGRWTIVRVSDGIGWGVGQDFSRDAAEKACRALNEAAGS